MSRIVLSALLGTIVVLGAVVHAAEPDRPVVLDALQSQGLTVMAEFPLEGTDLRGFAALAHQRPIAVYVASDGSAIVGTRVDRDAQIVDEALLEELVTRPMGEQMWAQLEAVTWVRDGREDAPRVVYAFSDPNCPFCNRFWHAARPWVDSGRVQLRHVLVGMLRKDSANKAAAILSANDPEAALTENETRFSEGGIQPVASVSDEIAGVLEANQALMIELGFRGTPAVVFRDNADFVRHIGGMPTADRLEAVMGPR
ncbi:MAG: thiol:disulfide interchange protein DsbG [Azoarcus sp.]|nr:thiol:disulfide interchange protein DsbG [Azoarcus sp.]